MTLEQLLFLEELSTRQQQELEVFLHSHPDLARQFARWQALEAWLRQQIERYVPDRSLLVLYALYQQNPQWLTAEEIRWVESHLPSLQQAAQALEGFTHVIEHIQEDAQAFSEIWDHHRSAIPTQPQQPTRIYSLRWVTRIAAVITLLAFSALLWSTLHKSANQQEIVAKQLERVTLPDGSIVHLMPGTRLTYATDHPRQITLQGKALLEVVTTAEKQPFQVTTEQALIQVLGTTFSVTADDQRTEVILALGKVALISRYAPDTPVILSPAQRSYVEKGKPPAPPSSVDLNTELAWSGYFFFNRTPLQDLLETLEDSYGITIEASPELLDEEITGVFRRTQPLEEILDALATTLQARVLQPTPKHFLLKAES